MARVKSTRKPRWKNIHSDSEDIFERTAKMRVEGGYLYKSIVTNHICGEDNPAVSVVFVPDTKAKQPR